MNFANYSYSKSIFHIVLFLLVTPIICNAQMEPDSITTKDRKFFDYLPGKWKIASFQKDSTITYGGDDIYEFNIELPGALSSKWHFNRGTKEKPSFADAFCYMAYNNLTRNWSFYYISNLSAQYFDGQKSGNNWYFYRSFDLGKGNKFIQKQYWILLDPKTLERHTENSYDDGKTWKPFSISVLSKQGS